MTSSAYLQLLVPSHQSFQKTPIFKVGLGTNIFKLINLSVLCFMLSMHICLPKIRILCPFLVMTFVGDPR